MLRWLERLRAWRPRSLAAQGTVVVLLAAVAVGGPGYATHCLLARQAQARQQYEAEASLAAALADCVQRMPVATADRQPWLAAVCARAERIRWAGVFDHAGHGVEFRRRTSLPQERIVAQIDFGATRPQRKPLAMDGAASDRLELLTFPQPEAGVTLAVLLNWNDRWPTAAVVALAALACAALAGLAAASAWFHFAVCRPIRGVSQTLAQVQAGLSDVTLGALPPAELAQLVESVASTQQELEMWRVEASYLRHSVEVEVDARTRRANRTARMAEHAAETDALTRLGNRRALEREMPRLFEVQRGAGGELSVVMIDVDNFKRLNDSLGHLTGDALLSFIGALMRSITRKGSDVAIRYGGDEFVLLLPGTTVAQAREVAERLALLFAQRARTIERADPPARLSAGVAALHHDGARSWQELLRLADEAMYAAKRRGGGVATAEEARAGRKSDNAVR